jgi:hypothetical protein
MSVRIDETEESGTGEEEALLQEMIVERDRKIQQLIVSTEACDRKIVEMRALLQQTRTDSATARLAQIHLEEKFEKHKSGLSKQTAQLTANVLQQNGGLHVYANVLKEASPESTDSSYVIRMQSQLCKAMHCMGAMEHQLDMVTKHSADTIGAVKGSMTKMLEEKTMVEIKLMNELMQVDTHKRKMEDGLRLSRSEFQESQRVFSLSQSFVSDENENNEDKEEIDEDLLLEILEERREDIAAVEEENAKQLQEIEDINSKIAAQMRQDQR